MEYRKFNEEYYIRLDKGDELISSLLSVCEREGLRLGRVHGIGGCEKAVVGVFDAERREYEREQVEGLLEMISLDGNVTEYEDKPYIHLHATFAYRDGGIKLLAGHLLEAVIGLTGEIVISPADGAIGRRYIEELGIRTWDFGA